MVAQQRGLAHRRARGPFAAQTAQARRVASAAHRGGRRPTRTAADRPSHAEWRGRPSKERIQASTDGPLVLAQKQNGPAQEERLQSRASAQGADGVTLAVHGGKAPALAPLY